MLVCAKYRGHDGLQCAVGESLINATDSGGPRMGSDVTTIGDR